MDTIAFMAPAGRCELGVAELARHPARFARFRMFTMEDRYERAATIIVSQLPVGKWHEYLDEPTVADAILDRLIPKAHRVELKGKSLRKRSENLSS